MATTTALMSQMKPRRSYSGSSSPSSVVQQPASVARRNARERNRVKQVNNGFATLRSHIPASVAAQILPPTPTKGAGPQGAAAAKKLSKVETLRMAVEYIRSLQAMLQEPSVGSTPTTPSLGPCYAPQTPQTPPCSEPSGSPASSYGGGCGNTGGGYHHRPVADNGRDDYEPMSPEDEELLDVISWWQQSQ